LYLNGKRDKGFSERQHEGMKQKLAGAELAWMRITVNISR
jgi:hypothetical protein